MVDAAKLQSGPYLRETFCPKPTCGKPGVFLRDGDAQFLHREKRDAVRCNPMASTQVRERAAEELPPIDRETKDAIKEGQA